jgi:hypothetical protein
LSKILSIWSEAGISGKVMQVVALPHSTTGQVQTVAQETKNCTWKISGRCWKVRHRHMPLWGGAMMQRFTTMAAAGEAFTSLDKMAVGDDSGLKSFKWPDRKRPRICVLGGGFGGLYTALRLDSLVWSPENQPQVPLKRISRSLVCLSKIFCHCIILDAFPVTGWRLDLL